MREKILSKLSQHNYMTWEELRRICPSSGLESEGFDETLLDLVDKGEVEVAQVRRPHYSVSIAGYRRKF